MAEVFVGQKGEFSMLFFLHFPCPSLSFSVVSHLLMTVRQWAAVKQMRARVTKIIRVRVGLGWDHL